MCVYAFGCSCTGKLVLWVGDANMLSFVRIGVPWCGKGGFFKAASTTTFHTSAAARTSQVGAAGHGAIHVTLCAWGQCY